MSPIAGLWMRREDGVVSGSAMMCAVCRRKRTRGARNRAGDIFVCVECQADARQFIEIQDSVWREVGEAGESSDDVDKSARP